MRLPGNEISLLALRKQFGTIVRSLDYGGIALISFPCVVLVEGRGRRGSDRPTDSVGI